MSKVAIVTDSTAYIPQNLLDKYHISVAPQVLIWGEETFEDGVDILPDEYYARLKNAKVMPSTSQATPSSFHKIFGGLLEKEYHILAILISEKLSGTIASAIQARDMLPGAQIEVVDSISTAMAMGFQVLEVAKAAEAGASLAECKQLAETARQHTGIVFAVDTLEFLHRGGRIGGANRFLGTALNIKPILEVQDGRVEAVERVRTRQKSINRLIELAGERISGRQPVRLAGLQANAREEGQELLQRASEKLGATETIFSDVSPVIGTHAGPGTLALAFMAGM
ncbi:MAG: DegV family protein [Chloroflexota bacterium]